MTGTKKIGWRTHSESHMQGFHNILAYYNLYELDFIDPFTWCDCVTKFRLDRKIMIITWSNMLSHSRDSHLPPNESDHYVPLLLEIGFSPILLHKETSI